MPGYSFETYGELQPWVGREWLQTNGTGAFAGSTLVGANARRYHGLLVAATLPPLGRMVALNRLSETIVRDGRPNVELAVNYFHGGLSPRGDQHLRRVEHYTTTAWTYDADGVGVRKELVLCWGRNVVGVRYDIDPGPGGPLTFRVQPFVTLRDFHGLQKADWHSDVTSTSAGGCVVRRWGHELSIKCAGAAFTEYKDWWYNFVYPIETERGQDDTEDLFTPGSFAATIDKPTTLVVWAGLNNADTFDWDTEVKKRQENNGDANAPTRVQKRLSHAAADFLAKRTDDGRQGATILAGFPWFADWGRDTMISLPGLLLCTGQYHKAGQVLSTFAGYVSEGMIPNNFDDYNNQPTYNTVDASLWYVHAAFEYLRLSHDQETFDSILRPACQQILDGYRRGTRYGIKMDGDGLITQGDPTTQLTWMDAKNNGVVFTPRHGKVVEINALWYHALKLMGEDGQAAQTAESFRRTFWINTARGLADVRNETGRDDSCRPNQIFAVSLPNSPLTDEQQRTVVDVVRRELLTPFGLRTLATNDPKYQPRYAGSQFERDRSYHNGAIWPWLIGAFLDAHLKVNGRSQSARQQARTWLQPLIDSLEDNCVGQISEIYEAQTPHRAVGCYAQAWSVAEVLRLAIELEM